MFDIDFNDVQHVIEPIFTGIRDILTVRAVAKFLKEKRHTESKEKDLSKEKDD